MPTLPRLSSDGRQIKTYAKQPADKKNPNEVKESSFGVSLKAVKRMKTYGIYLVFDIENSCLHFATEEECAKGTEPGSKKFFQIQAGKEMGDAAVPMKSGFLFLKPYFVKISTKASMKFKPGALEIKQGVKEKDSIEKTIDKCRLIWTVIDSQSDNFPTLQEKYPEEWDKLPDDKKAQLGNYILIDKNKLAKIEDVPYYKESIEYAKSKGIKDAQEEAEG